MNYSRRRLSRRDREEVRGAPMQRYGFGVGVRFRWRESVYIIVRRIADGAVVVENLLSGAVETVPTAVLTQAFAEGALRFVRVDARYDRHPSGAVMSATDAPARPAASPRAATPQYHDSLKGSHGEEVIERGLDDYPAYAAAVARYRLAVIRPLLAQDAQPRTRAAVQARVTEVRTNPHALVDETQDAHADGENAIPARSDAIVVSAASIYRWIGRYEAAGHDVRALLPGYSRRGGAGRYRLSSHVEEIIGAVAKELLPARERIRIEDIVREVAARVDDEHGRVTRPASANAPSTLPPLVTSSPPSIPPPNYPSRRTISRRLRINAHDQPLSTPPGQRRSRRQCGQMEYPDLPLARVEIDHTDIDLIVVDAADRFPLGRLTLTYCLDTTTRYPLGYFLSFEPASYLSVMECLYHAILPKPPVVAGTDSRSGATHQWLAYGIPQTLVVDNAPEFRGRDLDDACAQLGIHLERAPVHTPEFKAAVERSFGGLNTSLVHQLPGTTFSDLRARGDHDSRRHACLTLRDFERALQLTVLDVYAQEPHRGLGAIPARRWEAYCDDGFAPRLPRSSHELLLALARVAYRAVHPYGVEFEHLRYNCEALGRIRDAFHHRKTKRTKIKYHPGDLNVLYVLDPITDEYVTAPSLWPTYTEHLSLWQHQVILKVARADAATIDLAGLGRAKRKVQDLVDTARKTQRLATRQRVARWDAAGSTPSVAAAEREDHAVNHIVNVDEPFLLPPAADAILAIASHSKQTDATENHYSAEATPRGVPNAEADVAHTGESSHSGASGSSSDASGAWTVEWWSEE